MDTILKKEIFLEKAIFRTLGVFIFVVLTSVGALIRIPLPFSPVPITFQTMFVLLCGAFLKPGFGALSQLIYILLGILGVPLFTFVGSGLGYILGPTGGYLFGFFLAALFLGAFTKRYKGTLGGIFFIFCLADIIILACGTIWLKIIFGYTFVKTLSLGFIPFIPIDLFKVFIAAVIYFRLRSPLEKFF